MCWYTYARFGRPVSSSCIAAWSRRASERACAWRARNILQTAAAVRESTITASATRSPIGMLTVVTVTTPGIASAMATMVRRPTVGAVSAARTVSVCSRIVGCSTHAMKRMYARAYGMSTRCDDSVTAFVSSSM